MGQNNNQRRMGYVGVDSSHIWIGDPCYVMGENAPEITKHWQGFVDRLWDPETGHTEDRFAQPVGDKLGMAIPSGLGDGLYPVYATFDEDGAVATVTVDFAGELDD